MNRKLSIPLLIILVSGLTLPCAVQAADPDLVGWWKLDDASGTTAIDASGNDRDGMLQGDPQWVAGQLGGALKFDGTGDAVDLGNEDVFNFTGSFSISVWANIEAWNAGNWQNVMVGKHGESGQSWQLRKYGGSDNLTFTIRGTTGADDPQGTIEPTHGEWHHVVAIYDADAGTRAVYIDNALDVQIDDSGVPSSDDARVFIGARSNGGSVTDGPTGFFQGMIDDVYIFARALTEEEIPLISKGLARGLALEPMPSNVAADVPRDVILTWEPGEFAGTHNLYFGNSFDDVNSATAPTEAGLTVTSFDPGRLEFDQTYFWRVDEVNATPDKTVYRGDVWSFTAEPYSIQIPGSAIGVTASSQSNEFSTPDKLIDGSGLGANGTHSMDNSAMWFTAPVDLDPWIQFEFEDAYKMDTMTVWNSNSAAEAAIGWGVKDLEIQYSVDGETWDVLTGPHQLSRAPGSPTYNQYDTVPLDGVAARYVRLNIQSNWGGLVMSYGLSEVQFTTIPAQARTPEPASGSAEVVPNAMISWRAGREAAQHIVYVSADVNAVMDGSAPSVTTNTNSLSLSAMGAQFGQTYYWRVDEVNEAEAISMWAGPVWTLTTAASLTVDDFESYNNFSPDRPFQTWLDGFGYSADEFFSQGYAGNGTGSGIGHDIWSLSSPYFDGSIMETAKTMADSEQSMPFYYTNTGGLASQTDRTFAAPQDWTIGDVRILSIGILGQADNTGSLYVKINNVKRLFDGDVTKPIWQPWHVDLASLGINLNSITTMSFGVDGTTASGMVLIDEIRAYREMPEPPETVSLVNDFDSLAVNASMHDVDGWEGWFGDAQYGGKVTDAVAYSGTNALEIKGGRDDLVPHWPLVDSGLYVASVMQYVPSSTTNGIMFFAPLRIYGSNWDETAWMKDLRTDCGTGLVFVNDLDSGSRTEAPLIRDQWVQLRLVMNFDADACDFYYGEVHLGTTECPSIQAFDIYPDGDVDVVYYDDFRFESQ